MTAIDLSEMDQVTEQPMHHAVRELEEARIRREIARLEAAYSEASEAGLKIATNAAARALRWALDGGVAPSGRSGDREIGRHHPITQSPRHPIARLAALVLMLLLAGCAGSPAPADPMWMDVPSPTVDRSVIDLDQRLCAEKGKTLNPNTMRCQP